MIGTHHSVAFAAALLILGRYSLSQGAAPVDAGCRLPNVMTISRAASLTWALWNWTAPFRSTV